MFLKVVFKKRYWHPKYACIVLDCIAYMFNWALDASKAILLKKALCSGSITIRMIDNVYSRNTSKKSLVEIYAKIEF